jgi:hypothetical protein
MANSRNYRTPTTDDDPDVPYWNDLLAQDVANDVDGIEEVIPEPLGAVGVAWALTDAAGHRSWMEISDAGRMTEHSIGIVSEDLAPAMGEIVDEATAELSIPEEISPGSGLSYVITDEDGRKSELQLDFDGKFTGPFPGRIIQEATDAAVLASNPSATVPLVLWGDSMTAAGSGYGDKLAAEAGVAVRIQGIGGQGTPSISARQGGYPSFATFPNDTIPASGAATVTVSTIVYSSSSGTGTSSGHVTISGVPGTLARDNATNVHTFTRDAAGTAVWSPPTSPIITDEATLNRGQIAVIWSGRNSFKTMTPEDIVFHISQMVAYMTAGKKNFLVLEIAPTDAEVSSPSPTADRVKLDTLNALLLKTFPHNFLPVARYLRGPALADMGLTPTAQDTTDIANGVTPTSLRGDTLHLNSTGNTAAARFVSNTLKAKGWI